MDDDGWSHYDPLNEFGAGPQNSWTFPDGGYRLQAAATPNPALGPGRVASLRQDIVYTAFYITVDLVDWNNDYIQAMGIFARVNEPGPGTTDGYTFGFVSGPAPIVDIARVTDEGTSSISTEGAQPLLLDPSQDYRLEFTGKLAALRGRVFALSDLSHPILTMEGTDSLYNSGTAGLLAFSLNSAVAEPVDTTFDNYFAQDHEPPKMEIEMNSLGELMISWPSDIPVYRFECSPVLPATTWTEITTVFDNGLRWQFISEPGGIMQFYRLTR